MKTRDVVLIIFLILITLSCIYISFEITKENEAIKNRGVLNITQNDSIIKNAILKNADLKDLQYIFNDIAEKNKSFNYEDYIARIRYASGSSMKTTPFSEVLKIIKSYYLQQDFKERDSVLKRLDNLIVDFEQTNPFDILKKNQRFFLENIRDKSGQNYIIIESDINELVNEIDHQNKLVEEYLSNAKDSHNNSKIAMTIAILSLLTTLIINLIPIFKKKRNTN